MVDGVVFYINREGIFRNALTLKVKHESISENPLTICVNVILHKYLRTSIVFNQASENQPGIGRWNRKPKVGGAVRAGEGICRQIGSYGTPLEQLRPGRAERGR
ncbi:hypothetical protein C0033_22455 [Clostridium sp. chh4-2]|nr:hypothetical protein C0033_22455 [Clostridium sp. chh4-2]